jgi:hypothetical protein
MDLRDQNNGCVRPCCWKTQFYTMVHERKLVLANPMMRYLFYFMCADFFFASTIVLKPICSICMREYRLARKRRKNFSINCKMNGGMCKIEYIVVREAEKIHKMKRERKSSLTSYGVRRQQVQGYSLQKATYTHFHVYVLCTLVPFISSPVIHTNIVSFVALGCCI